MAEFDELPATPEFLRRAMRGMMVGKSSEAAALCVLADAFADMAWKALCAEGALVECFGRERNTLQLCIDVEVLDV